MGTVRHFRIHSRSVEPHLGRLKRLAERFATEKLVESSDGGKTGARAYLPSRGREGGSRAAVGCAILGCLERARSKMKRRACDQI